MAGDSRWRILLTVGDTVGTAVVFALVDPVRPPVVGVGLPSRTIVETPAARVLATAANTASPVPH